MGKGGPAMYLSNETIDIKIFFKAGISFEILSSKILKQQGELSFLLKNLLLHPLRRDNGLAQLSRTCQWDDGLWIELNFVFVSFWKKESRILWYD